MSNLFKSLLFIALTSFAMACSTQKDAVELKYEQYTLDNGLKVVLHQDLSDPMVAIAIQYHVGSGREKLGKTGFAHFFEHMLFQRSENLPRNAFFQKVTLCFCSVRASLISKSPGMFFANLNVGSPNI